MSSNYYSENNSYTQSDFKPSSYTNFQQSSSSYNSYQSSYSSSYQTFNHSSQYDLDTDLITNNNRQQQANILNLYPTKQQQKPNQYPIKSQPNHHTNIAKQQQNHIKITKYQQQRQQQNYYLINQFQQEQQNIYSKFRHYLPFHTFISPFAMNRLIFIPTARQQYLKHLMPQSFRQQREYKDIRQKEQLLMDLLQQYHQEIPNGKFNSEVKYLNTNRKGKPIIALFALGVYFLQRNYQQMKPNQPLFFKTKFKHKFHKLILFGLVGFCIYDQGNSRKKMSQLLKSNYNQLYIDIVIRKFLCQSNAMQRFYMVF